MCGDDGYCLWVWLVSFAHGDPGNGCGAGSQLYTGRRGDRRGALFTMASGATCFFVFVGGVFSSYFLSHFHWRVMWLSASLISLLSSLGSWILLKWPGSWNAKTKTAVQNIGDSREELTAWLKSPSGVITNLIFLGLQIL